MKEIKSVSMLGFESVMRQRVREKIRKLYKFDTTVYFANDSQLFIEFLGSNGSPLFRTQFDNVYAAILNGLSAQAIADEAVARVRQYIINQFFYLKKVDKESKI